MGPLDFPNRYCPHVPTAKQRLFLELECLEAFFGGAAGGGKSEALLMAALQYVASPGYAALIVRKDVQRLALAGGMIPRSHHWLATTGAEWNGAKRQWLFPNAAGAPATLTFGYLAGPLDKYRYASSEFQYIAFDELTELAEEDYLFLFSRLRRVVNNKPPVRVRAASNPGGVGHLWVKRRFVGNEAARVQGLEFGFQEETNHAGVGARRDQEPGTEYSVRSTGPLRGIPLTSDGGLLISDSRSSRWLGDRAFVPSRLIDNPFLNADEYRASLLHLPPLARERLLNGDWSVQEEGLILPAWLRYFIETERQLELLAPGGRTLVVVPDGACRRFVTIDPAGTSADRTREARGRTPSWSVVQIWDQPRRELARFLLLRHQVRSRVGFDGLCQALREVHARWCPERMYVEDEKLGRAALDVLERELPLTCLRTGGQDKVARAARLILKLERGEVFLPRHENSWRLDLEAEWLAWTGDERQPADQIDAAAYAAIVAGDPSPATIHLAHFEARR